MATAALSGPVLPVRARLAKFFTKALLITCAAAALPLPLAAQEAGQRVAALGGTVSEIVYALGEEDRLIARDTTSTYPPEVQALPDVGYVRALSAEGVLSVNPDMILAEENSGPQETLDVLAEAQIPFIVVPDGYDGPAILRKIEVIAGALGVEEKGEALAARVEAELAAAVEGAGTEKPARVLFILSMAGGRLTAAGTGTAADGIITLAGAQNVFGDFAGYKQVSDEAVLEAAPDVILMMERGGDHGGTADDVAAHPVLGQTPAAARGAILRQPGLLLLGFGPRTPEAVTALSAAIAELGAE
ncbi:heme/hemin ABC transporter substrate-binding protein [Vannielia litorea]|uniref:heme/hemin ABC transporter substrate-binding protein n=1 Tax=Vannielia litorea TaxID=1217970 RepID=UPI001BCC1A90|nr:ABC transporter substrate-binding protein [Vannielia litorea]MBS8227715.1 hemin ABC transporter substrate-binding protein [Vannielia litorea]